VILACHTTPGASALANHGRTVIITKTKSLQQQYASIYGAFPMMGKSNYPCIHPNNETKTSYGPRRRNCDDCLYQRMSECPHSRDCKYLLAKHRAMSARLVVVNYAYWLASKSFRERGCDYLILDECHLVPDITVEYAGCTITALQVREWGLPDVPKITSTMGDGLSRAVDWLSKAVDRLISLGREMRNAITNGYEEGKDKLRKLTYFYRKLNATLLAIESIRAGWYVRSGPGVVYTRGRPYPGMILKPLTAKYHFSRYFLDEGWRTVLMSATVGDPDTFATVIGIDSHDSRIVPNQFPPESRPVYLLNAPRLSNKSGSSAYEKQADEIVKALGYCPEDWSGIIHVTRKKEAPLLRQRLIERGVPEKRLWVPPVKIRGHWLGTQEQEAWWGDYRRANPNAIMIAWQFWTGADLLEEKICIAAKCPFPSLASDYHRQRMKADPAYYRLRTAWELAQGLGRTRRGRPEDYDLDGKVHGFVGIADGNWTRIKKVIPRDGDGARAVDLTARGVWFIINHEDRTTEGGCV